MKPRSRDSRAVTFNWAPLTSPQTPAVAHAGVSVVRATALRNAADTAQAQADAIRPRAFARREDRLQWQCAEDVARAANERAARVADSATTSWLRAHGVHIPAGVGRRRW